MTKLAVMVLLVLLLLGAEKLYNKYSLPPVPAYVVQEPVGGGGLLGISAAMIGVMLIDCSCVQDAPLDRFIYRQINYRCARTEVERMSALHCFECIIKGERCPWSSATPPTEATEKERRDKVVQDQVFKEVFAAQNAEPIASVP